MALGGTWLALSSTLAGNAVILGRIANIIVVWAAERPGIHIGWRGQAGIGGPVTLATLAVAGARLCLGIGAG